MTQDSVLYKLKINMRYLIDRSAFLEYKECRTVILQCLNKSSDYYTQRIQKLDEIMCSLIPHFQKKVSLPKRIDNVHIYPYNTNPIHERLLGASQINYLTLYIDRKCRMPSFNGIYISKNHILERTDYFAQLVK